MSEIVGIVMAVILFAGFGFLTRGKKPRDCHDCIERGGSDSCAGCPITDGTTGSFAPHTRGDSPKRNQLRLQRPNK